MHRLKRTARWTITWASGVLALLLAADGLAQSGASGFAGRWAGGPTADALAPPLVLDVAMTDVTLVVGERSADGRWRRVPVAYALNADTRVANTGRTFRWLAPDRLEVHDLLINTHGTRTAVTAVWDLLDGGRTLRIRRTLRALDDATAPLATRVATYRRTAS